MIQPLPLAALAVLLLLDVFLPVLLRRGGIGDGKLDSAGTAMLNS